MSALTGSHTLAFPVTVTFARPGGEAREEVISEVTLRRPKGKDMRVLDSVEGGVGRQLAMIARLSDLPVAVVDEFDEVDLEALGKILDGFSKPGRATGGTSSAT